MSAPGNPYENAVAERVNGILKTEYCKEKVSKKKLPPSYCKHF